SGHIVRVFETLSGTEVVRIGTDADIRVLTTSRDDLAIGTPNGSVQVFQALPDASRRISLPSGTPRALSPDGRRLAIASHEPRVLDLESGKEILSLPPSHGRPTVRFSADGNKLAYYDGEKLHVYDLTGRSEISVGSLPARVGIQAFSPDGSRLAVFGN